MANSLFNFD